MLGTRKSLHTAPENNYSPSRPFVCMRFVVDKSRGGIYHWQTGWWWWGVHYKCPALGHIQPQTATSQNVMAVICDSSWFMIPLRSNPSILHQQLSQSLKTDSAVKHFCMRRSSVQLLTLELPYTISIEHVSRQLVNVKYRVEWMVRKCWLSRHSTPSNNFLKFLQQQFENLQADLYDSRNRSLIIKTTAWAPHTEPKLKTRVGWTKIFFF